MSLVENLNLKIGEFELQIPRLELLDEGITALVGPSGSGKSTLVRILLGLQPCPGFTWTMNKVNLAAQSVEERNLGVVFQNYELFPHMTAAENIVFSAQARGISEDKATPLYQKLIKTLQLQDCLNTRAENLSGGEKQRVAVARALMGKPVFLMLDEPFSALDSDLKDEARNLVLKVLVETKTPAMLITHDESDIEKLASKVVHMKRGRLL